MKGRGMNILKPIIICLVLVALEPITLYAQENIAKGQAGYLSIHDKTKGLKLGGQGTSTTSTGGDGIRCPYGCRHPRAGH